MLGLVVVVWDNGAGILFNLLNNILWFDLGVGQFGFGALLVQLRNESVAGANPELGGGSQRVLSLLEDLRDEWRLSGPLACSIGIEMRLGHF